MLPQLAQRTPPSLDNVRAITVIDDTGVERWAAPGDKVSPENNIVIVEGFLSDELADGVLRAAQVMIENPEQLSTYINSGKYKHPLTCASG